MDKDREAFDAFARKNTMIDLRRNDLEPSFYEVYATQDAWRLWQAALAYARERIEGAESRADAFFGRALSTPEAREVLERGDANRLTDAGRRALAEHGGRRGWMGRIHLRAHSV